MKRPQSGGASVDMIERASELARKSSDWNGNGNGKGKERNFIALTFVSLSLCVCAIQFQFNSKIASTLLAIFGATARFFASIQLTKKNKTTTAVFFC